MTNQATTQVSQAVATVRRTHPARAYQRYGDARGNVLAGGIAYFAFFSVFPALAIGLTITGFVMRGRSDVRDTVIDGVSTYLPGMVHAGVKPVTGAQPGIYVEEYLRSGGALTWSLVVSLAVLLFTGLGWIDGMRQGIRAVFGEDAGGPNAVLVKAYDLLALLTIGVGVVLSVSSVLATTVAGGHLLHLFGMDGTTGGRWMLSGAGFAVALVIDTLTFLAVFRVLPGADVPLRDLFSGAVLGGLGMGVLKQFGTSIAQHSASGNAFLGAAASVVVLLVFMNLIGRLILFAAARRVRSRVRSRSASTVELGAETATAPTSTPAAFRTPTAAHVCPTTNSWCSHAMPRSATSSRWCPSRTRDVIVDGVSGAVPCARRYPSRCSGPIPASRIFPKAVACAASWKPNRSGRRRGWSGQSTT